MASLPPLKSVSGAYKFAWSRKTPRLQLTDLQLSTGAEVFTCTHGHRGVSGVAYTPDGRQLAFPFAQLVAVGRPDEQEMKHP